MIFALCSVFGEDAAALFPRTFSDIEEEVLGRASQLFESLQGREGKVVKRKLDCLEEMLSRACQRSRNPKVWRR